MYDSKAFFDSVRKSLFRGSLTQAQVDGMSAILSAAEAHQVKATHLAYMLATTFHETARTMQPIEEYGKGRGHRYGIKDPQTGQTYYGRGYVQLTWKANYEKAGRKLGLDLVNNPAQTMEPAVAARIMILGMQEGWFTGRKLSDYDRLDGQFNAVGARRIINGRNKKRYEQRLDADADYDRVIAGHYESFLLALKLSATNAPVQRPVDATPSPPVERDAAPQREQGQTDATEPSLVVKFFRWLFR